MVALARPQRHAPDAPPHGTNERVLGRHERPRRHVAALTYEHGIRTQFPTPRSPKRSACRPSDPGTSPTGRDLRESH
jgi:hypothetical protein